MTRLIKANIFSLLKTSYIYLITALSAILGAAVTYLVYLFPTVNMPPGAETSIDTSEALSYIPNFGALIIPFLAAAAVGLFLESEYTCGVIRNKFICGFTRGQVFLSQLFTLCIVTVVFFAAYEGAAFGMAVLVLDYSGYDLKAVAAVLGTMLMMILASSTLLSMLVGSFFHGGKLIAALLGIQYAMNFFLIISIYKKDYKILDLLTRIVPQGCLFEFTYVAMPEKIGVNFALSLIFAAAVIGIGYGKFRKCDIK